MRIATLEDTVFALRIENYEFPNEDLAPNEDNPADEFDPSRFLILSIQATNRDGSWSATGPVATTSDIRRLADWLDSIADKRHSEAGVYFTG